MEIIFALQKLAITENQYLAFLCFSENPFTCILCMLLPNTHIITCPQTVHVIIQLIRLNSYYIPDL